LCPHVKWWGDVIRLSLTRDAENSAVVVAMTTFALSRSLVYVLILAASFDASCIDWHRPFFLSASVSSLERLLAESETRAVRHW